MRPMLATKGDHVPTGDEWLHEVKWDGMRVIVEGGRLFSRNENDVSVSFPELALPPDVVLDGEVVAFRDGLPSFGALQERMHVSNARKAAALAERTPVTLLLFDCLRIGDRDLLRVPLAERRDRLTALDLHDERVQTPAAYDDGAMLLEATRAQGLEGIVSKRRSSIYEPGVRSRHWLKFPHRLRSSWVVGGWRLETDSDARLGAVLVGEPTAEGLIYRGRVGSGITSRVGAALKEALASGARETSPFADEVPRADALGTRWVDPIVVVEVESLGLSRDGRLRQPSFQGVRADLTPADLEDQS